MMSESVEAAHEIERLKARMIGQSYYVMFRHAVDRSRLNPDILLSHYRWIIDTEKAGHVFASGPLFDDKEGPGVGMTVFRCANSRAAAELAAGDPFVTCGAMTFEIKRWLLNEGRITVSIDLSDQAVRLG